MYPYLRIDGSVLSMCNLKIWRGEISGFYHFPKYGHTHTCSMIAGCLQAIADLLPALSQYTHTYLSHVLLGSENKFMVHNPS